MKRDMDLIRKLLFYFEESKDTVHDDLPKIKGYEPSNIKYHIYLMHDSNLLHCEHVKSDITGKVLYLMPLNLSWDGNEFLEMVRSNTTWERIKKTIVRKGDAFTFSNINQLTGKNVTNKAKPADPHAAKENKQADQNITPESQPANQNITQKKYSLSPNLELKWKTLIEKNPADQQVHALHALALGLSLKEEREDITNKEACRIFEKIKMSLNNILEE